MTLPSEYYEENLYPLQDGVLNIISRSDTDFFLTGGTALSRAYYNHRYSDDLDFFLNKSQTYDEQMEEILALLRESGFVWDVQENFIYASKDVADIREIATQESINWEEIIREAKQKEAGLEITYVCEILKSMPRNEFDSVAWVKKPMWEVFCEDIERIVRDMLMGGA